MKFLKLLKKNNKFLKHNYIVIATVKMKNEKYIPLQIQMNGYFVDNIHAVDCYNWHSLVQEMDEKHDTFSHFI